MKIPRHRALALLTECTGDEIWSVDHCRLRSVPDVWVAELSDAFESGYQTDRQRIYVADQQVNQYHGIRDVDLALKLAESLGLDVDAVTANALSRRGVVQAIKDAVMEG
ncbi:MAG: hypothetical protein HKN47_02575 [Pirellulaceae bacterium]|nr:hypothetical protein [Pirellulaceae bacterium]